MSVQSLESFRRQVNDSEQLQAAIRACGSDVEGMVAIGKRHGHEFTATEIVSSFSTETAELTDFELELVSAGAVNDPSRRNSTV